MGTLIPWSNFLRSAENAHTTQHWPRRPRTSPYKNSPHTVEVDKVHIGDKHGPHFLTNYHVVRPSKSQSTVHVLESLDQFGSSPARPLNQAIVMEGLARMDRDARLVRLDDRIESMREQHSEISSKLQQAELIGANPHPRLLQWMADYDSHMDSLLHQHAAVKRMPRVMGEAIFVSGKQRRGGRVIDWAFVELSKEAERECFRPNRMSAPAITVHRSQGMSVSDAVLDLSGHEFAAGLSCVMRIAFGDDMSMFIDMQSTPVTPPSGSQISQTNGRTTYVTSAICNGAKAYCHWGPSTVSEEFIVTSQESNLDHNKRDFCREGDSGAFVLDRFGTVTGLLWGGLEHYGEDVGAGF
ncbi:hypothetical protein N7535_002745 [Penicillium sp. DV-2018c]|nr:hypothetical protein N7535_002745 [Penicillium sp. DV-2018c]